MNNKEFKVVKIIDNETLIINAGKEDNIKTDDTFDIIGKGIEIIDPDTGDSLGFLDNVKETVRPIKIYDKMCACSHISNNSLLYTVANGTNNLYSNRYKKILNVDEDDIMLETNQDKTIRIGDKAKLKIKLPLPPTKKH